MGEYTQKNVVISHKIIIKMVSTKISNNLVGTVIIICYTYYIQRRKYVFKPINIAVSK